MYGLTRATTTLIGAAGAGFLIWLALETVDAGSDVGASSGEYWAAIGLFAAAGFVMALSQLLGGWTKWGWPRISTQVFLVAFLPVFLVTLWIVLAGQPADDEWLRGNILDWSADIGIEGLVDNFVFVTPLFAFGAGLVFGFTLDTSGPRLPSTETVITAPPRRADETVVEEETRVAEPARPRSED
jgi:hypothetical protein